MLAPLFAANDVNYDDIVWALYNR